MYLLYYLCLDFCPQDHHDLQQDQAHHLDVADDPVDDPVYDPVDNLADNPVDDPAGCVVDAAVADFPGGGVADLLVCSDP